MNGGQPVRVGLVFTGLVLVMLLAALDWTIVAPSALTLEPGTGRIELADHSRTGKVSRDDVAAVVAEVLKATNTIGKFVGFNQGETPIAEALASL